MRTAKQESGRGALFPADPAFRHRANAAPGSYFHYSNMAYEALGYLLEALDGRSLAESFRARILAPLYANKVMEGRRASLEAEMSLAKGKDWWGSALALRGENEPYYGLFNDIQHPAPWLD